MTLFSPEFKEGISLNSLKPGKLYRLENIRFLQRPQEPFVSPGWNNKQNLALRLVDNLPFQFMFIQLLPKNTFECLFGETTETFAVSDSTLKIFKKVTS